jgi:hypothetical protein
MKLTFGHALGAALITLVQAACAQPVTPPGAPPTAPPGGELKPSPEPVPPPPERGVIRPPANVDPQMRVLTPHPLPGSMPVIPPRADPRDPRGEPR